MHLSEELISEIAELLDCGLICYYHRQTGELESLPDQDDAYFDPEPWQDAIDKIEQNRDSYERFVKMNSNQAFRVMENFAHSLTDIHFKDRLLERLSMRKPFRNFSDLIDDSPYRQDWFKFKQNAYEDFVREQIPTEEE